MPYAVINKIRMHYEVAGHGDPVLLISGLSAPAANWVLQVRALEERYQVITFDNRGVGETDLPPEQVYTTAQMADDAAALLRHLRVKRAHVVGASMGGTVAQELALRQPRLVRSLVLACTWVEADPRFLFVVQSFTALAYRLPAEERYRHLFFPWLYTPAFLASSTLVETAVHRALAYPYQTKAEAIERQGRGILAWNGTRTKRLGSIRVPTLVLGAADDILTPPAYAREIARRIRHAQLKILPGAHGVFIEQPALFNQAVLSFLRGVRG
jgi:pimeloyl-ACP methyl ester carboxylesterase